MKSKYNFFISHSNEDKPLANDFVKKIEEKGYKCFIAPRDIKPGEDYNESLINAIEDCDIFLLLYSGNAIKSRYVLNEINSASSRDKVIINIRIEDIALAKKHEIYLGTCQWIDSFNTISQKCIESSLNKLKEVTSIEVNEKNNESKNTTIGKFNGVKLEAVSISKAIEKGISPLMITMREIEIDFLAVPTSKYIMNDEVEGTIDDWENAIVLEEDTSCLVLNGNNIVGYCDIYPVKKDAFNELIEGKKIIREDMIETYVFGGKFDAYIAMMAMTPEFDNQMGYLAIFNWFFEKLALWKEDGIELNNIGISVYSDTLEEIIKMFGFKYSSENPAKGKVYVTNIEDLKKNEIVKRKYSNYTRSNL